MPWTDAYTYLGFEVRWNLRDTGLSKRLKRTLSSNLARYFEYNSFVASSNAAYAFQVTNGAIVGAANYLLCLAPATDGLVLQLDRAISHAARRCLPADRILAPRSTAWLDARVPRALGILARVARNLGPRNLGEA